MTLTPYPRNRYLSFDQHGDDLNVHAWRTSTRVQCENVNQPDYPDAAVVCFNDRIDSPTPDGSLGASEVPIVVLYTIVDVLEIIHAHEVYNESLIFEHWDFEDWDWINHPDFSCLRGTDHSINTCHEVVRDNVFAEVRRMLNSARMQYNYPIAPDTVPAMWESGVALPGGSLVRDGEYGKFYYYSRYDMDAQTNVIAPSEDRYLTRFLPFNQGKMAVPEADISLNRLFVTDREFVTSETAYIDYENQVLYFIPGEDILEQSIPRFSLFSVVGENATLVAIVNHREQFSPMDGVTGWAFRFDRQWQAGVFSNSDAVTIGLSTGG